MSGFRLPTGGLVDRTRDIGFSFDGRALAGHAGDTLASALIAGGVSIVGRSFKYHRPRGVFSSDSGEPNALVELREGARREPNTKATAVELFEGLAARSQNRWPSLRHDLLAASQMLSRFLGAGFYYKTFMWPARFWESVYEPLIRRAAGLGSAAEGADPDRHEKAHAFCDVLVIGAGPAGLAAALTAARSGARVILADEDFRFGGRLLAERLGIDGGPAASWADAAVAELAANPRVRLMPRTTVFGVYDGGVHGAVERVGDHLPEPGEFTPRQRFWKIVARRAVLAAGATERLLVFGDNDRPGVMLAGAVRAFVNRFAAAPGKRVGVYACCDDGWKTVFDCVAAGIDVPFVMDARREPPEELVREARRLDVRVLPGARPAALRTRRGALSRIEIRRADGGGERVDIDCLAVSGGWNPTIALAGHHGARPRWDDGRACFLAANPPPGMIVAGAARALFSLREALADGVDAGARAAEETGFAATVAPPPRARDEFVATSAFWHVLESRGKAFVDLQNDVTADDIALAHGEGYRAAELLKRYTTLGMATEQGRAGNVAGLAIMAALTGEPMGAGGVTTSRPPWTPVAIGALAGAAVGKRYRPSRRTPAHDLAASAGARFVETGLWPRAQCFPRAGETLEEAATREARRVRSSAGFCDVSTLGKFEVFGRDAAAFLDRVYANAISSLEPGRARYSIMLREDGFLFDDGAVARLSPARFLATSSTGAAERVHEHFEYCRQVLWPDLAARVVRVTDQWAQFALAGPRARYILAEVFGGGLDVSNAALPFMAAREARLPGGVPARIFRVSFSGELAFEIAAPAGHGEGLARALERAGASLHGLDALDVLRVEKGHAADSEINGQTSAFDLGLSRMLSMKKDYVGRSMAARPALNDPARQQLVGVRPLDPDGAIFAGARMSPRDVRRDEGHVTSACLSPALGRRIGLALLARGRERMGETMTCVDPLRGHETAVVICDPVFVDPKGERARG